MNVMGRVFMPPSDDPFRVIDGLLESLSSETTVRIVDVHAEATSEKVAMGWHLDGRVSAVSELTPTCRLPMNEFFRVARRISLILE